MDLPSRDLRGRLLSNSSYEERAEPRLALDAFDMAPEEVRERIAWALRQGQPQWLWPDVDTNAWSQALEQVAVIAGEVLTRGRSASVLDGDGDAKAVGLAGYTSGMGPMLGYWLERGQIACSPPVAAMLELHLRHNRLRMERMAARAGMVRQVLDEAGVASTLLKGMHTAWSYFPDPGMRPLSDIDLQIVAEDEPAACAAMQASDFRQEGAKDYPPERWWRRSGTPQQPRSLCLVHADDPWVVDIHTSLNRRYAAGSPILRLDDAASVAKGAEHLPQPLLLLHLAVHAGCGLESLTLVRVVELVLVARRDFGAEPGAWQGYLGTAARAGALGCSYPALKLCEQLAPGTVPPTVLHALRSEVPQAVRRVVDPLSPANAQRVLRSSLAEHFMWAPSPLMMLRQFMAEALPSRAHSLPAFFSFGRARMRRLMRSTR